MKSASVQEIKQELQSLNPIRLLELCLRLAKFKKENKELLTYLLFESHDEEAYIQSVKIWMEEEFEELPRATLYLTKKSLRKILRNANKFTRYTGSKVVEAAILIHFCKMVKEKGISYEKSTVLNNLYQQQIKKIRLALEQLHEDLQYDLQKDLDDLLP
jgi:hypothetical protein